MYLQASILNFLFIFLLFVLPFFGTSFCFGGKEPKIEELGVMVESSIPMTHFVFFHPPTGQSHLLFYSTHARRGPFQLVDLNLDTGAFRVVDDMPGKPIGDKSTILHSSGFIYIGANSLMVYDPESGQSRKVAKLADVNGVISLVEGDDGAIYAGQWGKGIVERYDPKSGAWENLGVIDDPGPPYGNRMAYYLGADSRFTYIAMGQMPWYLVVYDRVSKTPKTFWKDKKPGSIRIARGELGGWYAFLSASDKNLQGWYKLQGDQPPQKLSHQPRVQSSPFSYRTLPNPEFEVDVTQAVADKSNDFKGKVRWHKSGSPQWQEAAIPLKVAPIAVRQLFPAPDGNLMGLSLAYGPTFTYSPEKGQVTILGRTGYSLYDARHLQGQWFFVGYPSAVWVYDPQRPWTHKPGNPRSFQTNPHPVDMPYHVAAKYFLYLAEGADGNVYIGGRHQRREVGMALGWRHPQTRLSGGLQEPFFERYNLADLITLEGKKKLVLSSYGRESGTEGVFFIFDIQRKELVQTLTPLPGEKNPGKLLEVSPGVVVGIVLGPPKNLAYRFDIFQNKLIWQKELPGQAFKNLPLTDARMVRGPDGFIWLYVDDAICRLDPEDGALHQVIKAPPAGGLLFWQKDLYIFGHERLRRITGLF